MSLPQFFFQTTTNQTFHILNIRKENSTEQQYTVEDIK